MNAKEITKDPLILTLIGLMVVFSLTATAVLLIAQGPSVDSTTAQNASQLQVTSNPGSTDNLQAAPLQLQSDGNTASQSDKGSAAQLQPQGSLTPEQLNNLQ